MLERKGTLVGFLISEHPLTFVPWVLPFYSAQHPRYQVPSEEEPIFGVSDQHNHLSLSRSVKIVRLEERCPPGPRQAEKQLLHNEERLSWIRQQGTVHILEIYQNHQIESGKECRKCSLPALLAFIDIRVKVDIRYITVKNRTSGLDHTIRKLGAHAYCVSTGNFQKSKNSLEGGSIRDASDALDFSKFDKIKGFDLLDDRTEK